MDARRTWGAVLTAAVLAAGARPAAAEVGFTEAVPSRDDPPAQTRSPKVRPSRDPTLPPALGPSPSKVRVVVFCDFQSPDCRRMTSALRQIPEEWPGEVRLEYHQLPGRTAVANLAAIGSLAAHQQGRFWPMHDCLYANQGALDEEKIAECAFQAGVDMQRYAKDYADPVLRERVRREAASVRPLGGGQAPAYTVNGRMHVGWGSWDLLRGAVERELKQVNELLAKRRKLAEVELQRARENTRNAEAFESYRTSILAPRAKATKSGSH